jgi:hypothetical protein
MRNTSHVASPCRPAEFREQGTALSSQVAAIVEELANSMAMLPDLGGREPALVFRPWAEVALPEGCR